MDTINNELNLLKKIMLSIFPVLTTLFFIDTVLLHGIPYEYYTKVWFGLFFLMIIQNTILVIRVTSKEMTRNDKVLNIILIFAIPLFHLYYVWYLDKKYKLRGGISGAV